MSLDLHLISPQLMMFDEYFVNSDETSHCKSDQKRYQRMHSTCFTSCNRCRNRLSIRPLNRLKHRSPVPARSPLVPQTGEVWRVGLACVLYTTPYACMCIVSLQPIESNFRRLCELHTQVSHFAQNIAKSPSDQP